MGTERAASGTCPLALVLLVVLVAGLVGCAAAQEPAHRSGPTRATVQIRDFGYRPLDVTVGVNGTVTWVNRDSVDHTVTGDSGSWGSGTLAGAWRYSHRFSRTGRFRYHCAFHAFMTGTVSVVK